MTSATEPRVQASGERGSPLASSAAFGVFAIVFAIAAPIIYVAAEIGGFPLFTYHPGTNRIDFGFATARPNEGPAMYWYGWLATTLVASALAGLVAAFLPRSLTVRIPLFLIWLLPLIALPILAYVLMPFWTR